MIKNILFTLLLIIVVGLITAFIIVYKKYFGKKAIYDPKGKKRVTAIGITGVVALGLLLTIPGSFHQVETGTVAVVRKLGKIENQRGPGTYFDFYMTRSYEIYDTKVQQDHILTSAYSKDGQTMALEVFLQYQVQVENIMKIATEYGNLDALQARIETVAVEKTKAVMSSAEAMTIVQNRSTFSNDVSESVRLGISSDYYVNVKDVVLTNIEFTREFEKAVEDKVIAEQEKQASITRAEAELEVAKLEAQRKITEAEGSGEAQKILARASAEAAAYKIIELARSLGYTVNETYTYLTTVEKAFDSGKLVITKSEAEYDAKQAESTTIEVIVEEQENVTKTTTVALAGTSYTIDVTSGAGVEQFKKLVEDYLEYLAYLEVWNGELPDVVSGTDAISIIIPNND